MVDENLRSRIEELESQVEKMNDLNTRIQAEDVVKALAYGHDAGYNISEDHLLTMSLGDGVLWIFRELKRLQGAVLALSEERDRLRHRLQILELSPHLKTPETFEAPRGTSWNQQLQTWTPCHWSSSDDE